MEQSKTVFSVSLAVVAVNNLRRDYMKKNFPFTPELEKITMKFISDVQRIMGGAGTYYAYKENMAITFATDLKDESIIIRNKLQLSEISDNG